MKEILDKIYKTKSCLMLQKFHENSQSKKRGKNSFKSSKCKTPGFFTFLNVKEIFLFCLIHFFNSYYLT